MKHIVLVGFMGSGKSTLGRLVGAQLGMPFVDSDTLIEQKIGMTVSQIFEQLGESAFRELEHAFCQDLERLTPSVIATGGKLVCSVENLALLRNAGHVIYVNASLQTLTARLKEHKAARPLLAGIPDEALFRFVEDEMTLRKTYYKQAHFILPNESNRPKEAVDKLVKWIENQSSSEFTPKN